MQVQTISKTPKIIARPRLVARLQAALDYRLTLISAPPGYGKTTLAAQFVLNIICPVAWHTLEERARDLPILQSSALNALSYIAPKIKDLTSPQGYTPAEYVALIADYLRQHVADDFLYIIDDIHQLSGSPSAESWLQALVALLPANCHLVLLSRSLPSLPLAEMIERGQLQALGEADLCFTRDEVRELGQISTNGAISDLEIEDLFHRLAGWPAGTVLALHPLPTDIARASLSGGEGPEALFDALATVMLAAQPPRIRDFLLISSTLARLIPEALNAALGIAKTADLLVEIQARNLFVVHAPGSMFYHLLWRRFLQHQLKGIDPERFARLHCQAAAWFEAQDQLDSALDHYLIAGQIERAAEIAARAAYAYFVQGNWETLLSWNTRLRDAGASIPALLYRCAVIYGDRYDYEAAQECLKEAEDWLSPNDSQLGQADIEIQRAFIHLQQGAYQEAVDRVAQFINYPASLNNIRGRALRILGYAQLRLSNLEAAAEYLEAAVPLHRADGDSHALSNVLQDLGMVYARLGHLDDAMGCLQEVIAIRRSLGSAITLALALNNLGCYYHRSSNYERASQALQEGLSIAVRFPNRRGEGVLRWSLGDLQRDCGNFDEAQDLYNKALELFENKEPALQTETLISSSILQRWRGNLAEALSAASDAIELSHNHRLAREHALAQAAFWFARVQDGETEISLTKLEEAATNLQNQKVQSELAQVLGLCAYVALRKGDPQAANQYLKSALCVEDEHASLQPLAAEVLHSPLLDKFVMAGSSEWPGLVHELERLRTVQIKTIKHASLISHTTTTGIFNLRVTTFGRESIECDGHLLPQRGWKATTVKNLFFYLLMNGPQSREQIAASIWPEHSTSQIRDEFHTALHRIRRTIGENVVKFIYNIYAIDPDIDLWCDAQEMVTLIRQARLLPIRDARTEDLWRKAEKLYQGSFLPTLYSTWIMRQRENFQELYVEVLLGIGNCARARGDIRNALEMYHRALGLKPYHEEAHRAIMICYADLGEKAQISQQLERLQTLLRQELSIEPSLRTLSLAHSLLK